MIRTAAGSVRTIGMPFASASVRRHYVRGLIGLLALVGAIAGTAAGVTGAVLLFVVTPLAWRGCPTCWAIGLMQTRERQACAGRGCRTPAPR